MEVYAHRGVSRYYPENTMLAFQTVLQTGATGIELDVQLSKDGEVVVIHDEMVNRTTNGEGNVKDFTVKQLKQLEIQYGSLEMMPTQRIPTLAEVLAWLVNTKLCLNIEFKTDKIRYEGIEEKVIRLVRRGQMTERVLFSSFNYQTLQSCKQLAPDIPANYLVSKSWRKPPVELLREGINGVNPNVCLLQIEGMARLYQEAGLTLFPYTVNTKEQLKLCKQVACNGIITDDPKQLLSWM